MCHATVAVLKTSISIIGAHLIPDYLPFYVVFLDDFSCYMELSDLDDNTATPLRAR